MANAQRLDDLQNEDNFADELAPGSTLMHGQYTIDAFLNAGGFGITYSARDSLERRVVIKECFPGSFCRRSRALVHARSRAHSNELASIVRLFVQEARSLSKLNHPNIVGVHQVFEENNTAYMALDFVEGRDLLEIIEAPEDVLSPEEVEGILRKVLDAVAYIHRQGVLHRDISPDNILLDSDLNPILIDFGAAREEASKQSRVLSAMRVVKDGYSPQEFYIAGSAQGAFSDLYALAATFYHLITGELPANSQARLSAVAGGQADLYKPLLGRVTDYRDDFLRAIDEALQILPQDRIETAEAWIAMLDGIKNYVPSHTHEALKKPAPATYTPPKRRSKKALLLASVALVAGVGVYLAQAQLGATNDAEIATVAEVAPQTAPADTSIPDLAALDVDSASAIPLLGAGVADEPLLEPEEESIVEAIPLPGLGDADIPALSEETANVVVESAPLVEPSEPEIAAVAEPSAPALVLPGTADISASLPQPPRQITPLELLDNGLYNVPGMQSGWLVDLPAGSGFAADGSETRIFEVNGVAVESHYDFDNALILTVEAPDTPEIEVDVLAGSSEASATSQTWVLPVSHKTVFENGYAFETTFSNDTWQTRVTATPNSARAEIQVGDIVAGSVTDSVRFDAWTSLPTATEQAILKGHTVLSVAVARAGQMVAVTLPLPAEALAVID